MIVSLCVYHVLCATISKRRLLRMWVGCDLHSVYFRSLFTVTRVTQLHLSVLGKTGAEAEVMWTQKRTENHTLYSHVLYSLELLTTSYVSMKRFPYVQSHAQDMWSAKMLRYGTTGSRDSTQINRCPVPEPSPTFGRKGRLLARQQFDQSTLHEIKDDQRRVKIFMCDL